MARNLVSASSQFLESTTAVATATPLTLAAWINPANNSGTIISVSQSTSGAKRFGLAISAASVVASHHDGSVLGEATGGTVTNGAWWHVAAVFASTASRTPYLSGVPIVTSTTVCSASMSGLNRTTLGRRTNTTLLAYYSGRIAEAAAWSVVLDDDEMAALARGVLPYRIRSGSMLAYWPLWGQHSPEIGLFKGTFPLTVTGATIGNHAPVTAPCRGARGTYSLPPVAAGGGGGPTFTPAALLMTM